MLFAADGAPNGSASQLHRDNLDRDGATYAVAIITSDQFGDHDALDHSNQRLVTSLAAQRLRDAAPGVYLDRTYTQNLQLLGNLRGLDMLQPVLRQQIDTH